MSQYTQAIGYVPAGQRARIDRTAYFHRPSTTRYRRYRPSVIDKAIRAIRIDRPIDHPIERVGKTFMPHMYPHSTLRGTSALGNPEGSAMFYFWTLAGILSVGASAYHGYKRNNSVGWAIAWGLLGGLAPVITPAVAVAQGFGKPKRG